MADAEGLNLKEKLEIQSRFFHDGPTAVTSQDPGSKPGPSLCDPVTRAREEQKGEKNRQLNTWVAFFERPWFQTSGTDLTRRDPIPPLTANCCSKSCIVSQETQSLACQNQQSPPHLRFSL